METSTAFWFFVLYQKLLLIMAGLALVLTAAFLGVRKLEEWRPRAALAVFGGILLCIAAGDASILYEDIPSHRPWIIPALTIVSLPWMFYQFAAGVKNRRASG